MSLTASTLNKQSGFVDLQIAPVSPKLSKKVRGKYRICTLTKKQGGEKTINLQLPADIQETILAAYQDGKQVRIFS